VSLADEARKLALTAEEKNRGARYLANS